MSNLEHNIAKLRERIGETLEKSGRDTDSVLVLAVSKTHNAELIRQAHALGLSHFGENYLQEALPKMQLLQDLPLHWHFIGPLQSNKTRLVAEQFEWVHTLDRVKIAQRLNDQRPARLPPLQVCLQVNIDDEASKSGVHPSQICALAEQVMQLPRLQLRGLMTIPKYDATAAERSDSFKRMATLLQELLQELQHLSPTLHAKPDTLSMGMSDDLESAIERGATIVRIGTALFGARTGSLTIQNNKPE